MNSKVLLLGSTGMLGSAIAKSLSAGGVRFIEASRTKGIPFDASGLPCLELFQSADLRPADVIINAVGLTKQRIIDSDDASRNEAIRLNTIFSLELARVAHLNGIRVYQVATDCVYSGSRGNYSEEDPHDPLDVYGKTKSLGESQLDNVMHIRASLIGPEVGRSSLFFEWLRGLPYGAEIRGFENHIWNGVTSQVFGDIVTGLIRESVFYPGVSHLVPANQMSKRELVQEVLDGLERPDVRVSPTDDSMSVNRTLATVFPDRNLELFTLGGFPKPPAIERMVQTLCSNLESIRSI